MIRKFLKYFKTVHIDVLIYSMKEADLVALPDIGFTIQKDTAAGKQRYFIMDGDTFVHQSFVFQKVQMLQLIGKKGPAIGDCLTMGDYKGRSIYPYVINHAARELLKHHPEVFIIVISDNVPSVRGIEKAGFKLKASIKAKKILLFYFNVRKQLFATND